MLQYNRLNVKLSNPQHNKLKSSIKNETEVVLRLSSNMVSDNETNFPHKLLLTNRQIFVELLQIIYQQMSNYQKLNYLRWYNQDDFLVDFLFHY